jgi:hypothetical protein
VADDIPAGQDAGQPAQGAVVAEILTDDGEITLPAGPGAGDVPVAAARHLVDLLNGRVEPAGTPSFDFAAGTLTVPVPGGGTVTISARNVTGRAAGGDPVACLARSLRSAGVPGSAQLPRRPSATLWGVGTNIQGRLAALEFPQASPWIPMTRQARPAVVTEEQLQAASLAARAHGTILDDDVVRAIITAAAEAAPGSAGQPGRSGATLLDLTTQMMADARLDRLEQGARAGHASPDQMLKLIAEVRRRRQEARDGAGAPAGQVRHTRATSPGRPPRAPGR